MKYLKVSGCVWYVQVPKDKRHKLDETSKKCIFVGYNTMSKGYRLYSLRSCKVIISKEVIFDENVIWNWEQNKDEVKLVL